MYQILIIEDEMKTAEPVKEALELCGLRADIASDGQEGIALLKNKEYDLVLLDLKMPGMSGEETLQEIRKIEPYIYVIVYTNFEDFVDMKKLVNIGIDGYIKKGPTADLKEVISMIQEKLAPLDENDIKQLIGGKL